MCRIWSMTDDRVPPIAASRMTCYIRYCERRTCPFLISSGHQFAPKFLIATRHVDFALCHWNADLTIFRRRFIVHFSPISLQCFSAQSLLASLLSRNTIILQPNSS
ncbi:hypothetical protein HGRIS_001755 [Hohenbuehelia grisea]|uniref:Uncharacterized protein n=1 Tax=Hohenbuehelia grisea TaxID=104357 RepID=A0ABR3JJD4_9AGAR